MKDSIVIYGPPGTGKTRKLMDLLAEQIRNGTPQNRIGLVSYTRAAAYEMADRLNLPHGGNVATIHSYAFRLVGVLWEQVVSIRQLHEFSKIIKIPIKGGSDFTARMELGDYFLATYSYQRATLRKDLAEVFHDRRCPGEYKLYLYFINGYEQWKKAFGLVDFEDMLELALHADPPDLDWLFIDEAQDLSPAQWKLIKTWLPHLQGVVLALDDDQALFEFNGANPDGGREFEQFYGSKRIILDKSWRVPSSIQELANKVIKQLPDRVDKDYRPSQMGGSIYHWTDFKWITDLSPSTSTLILYRNHSLRRPVEEWLQIQGLPYHIMSGKAGPREDYIAKGIAVWKMIQAAYQVFQSIKMTDYQRRALQSVLHPGLNIQVDDKHVEQIIHLRWDQVMKMPIKRSHYYQTVKRLHKDELPLTGITLSSIHGAKGREADRVVLLDGMTGNTVQAAYDNRSSEIRCMYVGLTRSRQRLDIVTTKNPSGLIK